VNGATLPLTTPAVEDLNALRALASAALRVEEAYSQLRDGAARLDRELAEANQRLASKVVELEHLSGSLAAVLSAIPSGVVVADADGGVIMANPAAHEILGVAPGKLCGHPARNVVDAKGHPLLLLARGECVAVERIVERADDSRVVRGSVVAVRDAANEFLGLVELLDDRTEVKVLEDEVRRLDRLAELGRVAAILAHEIRNPLSGIRGFAGMLERKLKDADGLEAEHRYARRICEGADRADAIIDSVLFLASPRPLRRDAVGVEALFCEVWENVSHADPTRSRGVEVRLDIDPRALSVVGDRVRLEQALTNLLTNALAAMNGRGRIELRAREAHGIVTLEVCDDGPGIPKEALPRLFEPFFTTKSEGAGLGLALVRRILDLHGGSVRAENQASRGAKFVLALPLHSGTDSAKAIA
jgi:two-component system, NtrC family, nitrogen regulation sensor histidine kinase GlnL